MRTFSGVHAVARDARWRMQRVAIFFEALFAVVVVGLVAIDRVPPRPRLECERHSAVLRSPYPHPYGEPPVSEWTTCVWRRAW